MTDTNQPMSSTTGRSGALWVALTGGLASGKSTVARMLGDAGATVIDADRLVAELYQPGEPGSRVVGVLFGEQYLTAAGGVDSAGLSELVFSDAEALRALEHQIHPLVGERFLRRAAEAGGVVVLEGTLLVEAGIADAFDVVVTVEADPDLRLERAVARGLDEDDARSRLAAQGDGATRRARADVEIVNEGSLAELQARVDQLYAGWREQLQAR